MISIDEIRSGRQYTISKAISLAEAFGPGARELAESIAEHVGKAYRIGITGPPGVGKSTLVSAMTMELRKTNKSVGIVAIDPTSPFTGGALLGDRIRMTGGHEDSGIFFRSMATRDGVGGIARATFDGVDILDASGKDIVIIETVGVGQSEVEISRCADCVVLVLSPESGDGIQAMKSGIMEIADIIVINKADRGGADKLEHEIHRAYGLSLQRRDVPIVLTEAFRGHGVDVFLQAMETFMTQRQADGTFKEKRLAVAKHRIQTIAEFMVRRELWTDPRRISEIEMLATRVIAGTTSPYAAAELMIQNVGTSSS